MAKKEVKNVYSYPSRFGSHRSMVTKDDGHYVECMDEHGTYITEASRLDNGMADPNRYTESRLGSLFVRVKKEKDK